jgi:hypothetical protein
MGRGERSEGAGASRERREQGAWATDIPAMLSGRHRPSDADSMVWEAFYTLERQARRQRQEQRLRPDQGRDIIGGLSGRTPMTTPNITRCAMVGG